MWKVVLQMHVSDAEKSEWLGCVTWGVGPGRQSRGLSVWLRLLVIYRPLKHDGGTGEKPSATNICPMKFQIEIEIPNSKKEKKLGSDYSERLFCCCLKIGFFLSPLHN